MLFQIETDVQTINAPIEDQPCHPPSLNRTLSVCMKNYELL